MYQVFRNNSAPARLLMPERSFGGQVLVVVIVFLAVILVTTLSIFSLVSFFTRNTQVSYFAEQALNLAEAGVDKAIYSLNTQGSSYTGETNTNLGAGTFTVTISDISIGVKEITSTGFIPNFANPQATKTVKVRVTAGTSTIAFHYAAQVGSGGLSMANSATVHGTVYSNGNITGGQSSRIEGDAFAVGTISSPAPLVTGTKNPGQPVSEVPTINGNCNLDCQKDAADGPNNDKVEDCSLKPQSTCIIKNNADIGPKKYIGNLEINNNAIVTMKGTVWVTGNFSIKQGGTTVKLDESFGSAGPYFIVDGTIDLTQGGTFIPTSANPKGYIMVVTTSTTSDAIKISQSGATAVFYALNGGAELSQTADVAALVAKTLSMSQSSELTYEQGLASASFTSGPGGSWQISSGTYKID